MKVIVRPRQTGKTTELIKLANAHNAIMVCLRHESAKGIDRKAKQMGLVIPTAVSYSQENLRLIKNPIIIDNADRILCDMLNIPHCSVVAMAMDGVPNMDYDEMRDYNQFIELSKHNKDLTYQKFIEMKYNKKFGGD